jgi:hypothetical protein
LSLAIAALVAGSSTAAFAHTTHATFNQVTCQQTVIPVAIAPGQPARYTVGGELCATVLEMRTGATVQVLIHGAAYTHDYWDFGMVDGVEYS